LKGILRNVNYSKHTHFNFVENNTVTIAIAFATVPNIIIGIKVTAANTTSKSPNGNGTLKHAYIVVSLKW